MKVIETPTAKTGWFYVAVINSPTERAELHPTPYVQYEAAEDAAIALSRAHPNKTVFVLQVEGEYRSIPTVARYERNVTPGKENVVNILPFKTN